MAEIKEIKEELARRAREIQQRKTSAGGVPSSIVDTMARLSPHLQPPRHLAPYLACLEEIVKKGNVNVCFHAPPQHGKTETTKHALIYFALTRPHLRHAYAAFSDARAREIRDEVKDLAVRAGLSPHTSGPILDLGNGGEIKFVGTGGGQLTGSPVDGVLILDDPTGGPKDALSPARRNEAWNWLIQVGSTRRHPGSSAVIMQTRWHLDDLIGRATKQLGWPYIRMPAICDSDEDPLGRAIGEPLWPATPEYHGRPLAWLIDQPAYKMPLAWSAMFQGNPRPQGDALFQPATRYTELPSGDLGYRTLYGVDLAYTEKTRSDWSVAVRGRVYSDGRVFLTKLLRRQQHADVYTAALKAFMSTEQGRALWFGSTTERGVAQLIRQQIPSFAFLQATADKYVRAFPTAEQLWNQGKILVPAGPGEWQDFCDQIELFTGQGDGEDDDVDALAALGHQVLRGHGASMGFGALQNELRGAYGSPLRLVGGR